MAVLLVVAFILGMLIFLLLTRDSGGTADAALAAAPVPVAAWLARHLSAVPPEAHHPSAPTSGAL